MKKLSLSFCLLFSLSACDKAPEGAAKPPRAERAVVVESVVARRADASRRIERNGTLRARHMVQLSLQQEGQLLELPYHEGDRVAQGALLARLDDTLLQAQLRKSQAQRRQAEGDLKRLKRLKSSRVVAEDELSRAITAMDVARAEEEELQIRLQQTRLLAPFEGIISERRAEPGDSMSRFSHLITLIDVSSLSTELQLSEMVLPGLHIGDEVSLTIDALGPQQHRGSIERIHPMVDEASRQGTIEVILSPPPTAAQPGQLCRVQLQLRRSERLLVPYNALRRDSRGEFLYVVTDEQKITRRAILSGLHFAAQVEVLDGLEPGERIVTRGFLGLSDGSTVKLAGDKTTP